MGITGLVSYYGSTITDVLNTWADYGVFAYLLPFLLIFALVFGILSKTNILGDNRAVQATIALAVGLLALQFDYVSNFFATITPYFGIALVFLLVAIILMGLVYEEGKTDWIKHVLFGLGALAFIILLLTTVADVAWIGEWRFSQHWQGIIILLIIIIPITLIIVADYLKNRRPRPSKKTPV